MTRLARGMTRISTLGIITAVLIVVLAIVVWLRPAPNPIPDREHTTLDSLAATAPIYTAQRETVFVRETTFVRQSNAKAAQSLIAARTADSLRQVAIGLERAAQAAGDSSSRWFRVADVRRVENDSLRSANAGLSAALVDLSAARLAADDRATAAERRLAATSDLADRLARDLKHGDCRVLFVLNCPSRRGVAVLSLSAGIAGGYYIARRFGR